MYFPYIRGRQYDLIALREALQEGVLHKHITPVVEPVRTSSTLRDTIKLFSDEERSIILIRNPQVGTYNSEYGHLTEEEQEQFDNLYKLPHVIHGYILSTEDNLRDISVNEHPYALFLESPNLISDIQELSPKYIFVPESTVFRRRLREHPLILWESRFVEERRNADYLIDNEGRDIFYSMDHTYYEEDNYVGFSDYSVISSEYAEGGFAPYAVAFHLVYFQNEGEMLFVKSFVSKSNDTIQDPASKYHEALQMFQEWIEESYIMQPTYAMEEFTRHYRDGSYPGLGTVKKLAFIHHFELITRFLEEL